MTGPPFFKPHHVEPQVVRQNVARQNAAGALKRLSRVIYSYASSFFSASCTYASGSSCGAS